MEPTRDVTHLLVQRPGGRIAVTVTGEGPLVVLVPGMGDLASTWRDVAPALVGAGYRVATTDLRGHGGSDTTFTELGDVPTALDTIAVVEELGGGPAVLVGQSMGGAAVCWAAAERPELVAGLVLVGPVLRTHGGAATLALSRLMYRALFARPWGTAVWGSYYAGTLSKGAKAPWLAEHVADIRTWLRSPGGLRSFRRLTVALDHSPVAARLDEVAAPAVVVVGALDPDFKDPATELAWMGQTLGAATHLVPDAAHYPHHQRPDVTVPVVTQFLSALPRTADTWAPAGA